MKSVFLAISVLLFFSCGTQAKDFEDILEEAVAQIFRETPYGFELSLEPYLNMEFDYRSEMTMEYSLTGDSPPNRFRRTWNMDPMTGIYTAITTDTGTVRNAGFMADIWSYHFRRSNTFSFRQEETLNPNAMSYSWDLSMTVDGDVSTAEGAISVANLDMVGNSASIKYVEKVDMKRNSPYCDISRAMGFHCPFQMEVDFTITAEAAQCANPQNSCSASISVAGVSNGQHVSIVLGYTARSQRGTQVNQVGVTFNSNNIFQLTLRTPPNSDVTNIFGKCGNDAPVHVLTLPNPRSFGRIGYQASLYFGRIGDSIGLVLENLPESVIWFDKIMATATNEFDCTVLLETTKIKIPVLNEVFQGGFRGPMGNRITGNNFQEFGGSVCRNFNGLVKTGLTEVGSEIASTRRYVNRITSPAYGVQFARNL